MDGCGIFTNIIAFWHSTARQSTSAAIVAVKPSHKQHHDYTEEERLSLCQLYNVDKTGLFWCLLPETIMAMGQKQSAPGRKKVK
jgi:hypothetical protein